MYKLIVMKNTSRREINSSVEVKFILLSRSTINFYDVLLADVVVVFYILMKEYLFNTQQKKLTVFLTVLLKTKRI